MKPFNETIGGIDVGDVNGFREVSITLPGWGDEQDEEPYTSLDQGEAERLRDWLTEWLEA